MAIVNNGTKNSLPDSSLPSGYSRPSVTEFTDENYVNDLVFEVSKAGVENATRATTMAQIISFAVIGITAQVDALLAKDFLASATVTAWADWVSLTNNYTSLQGDGEVLSDDAAVFICTVKLYIKVA